MNYTLFDLITFANACILLFLGLIQLSYRQKTILTYLTALLYGSMAYTLLYFWAIHTHTIEYLPWLINSDIIASFLIAPTLYLYFQTLTGSLHPTLRQHGRLYLPAVASVLILLFLKFGSTHPALSPLCTARPTTLVMGIASDVWIGANIFYTILQHYRIFTKQRLQERTELKILLVFLSICAVNALLMIASYVFHKNTWLILSTHNFGFLFVVYTLYVYRYPQFGKVVINEAKAVRYKQSHLRNINTKELSKRLEHAMQVDKIFNNMDLTLNGLSQHLHVTSHQLSEFLNNKFNMNFRNYLNTLRLEEAKKLLIKNPALTVLDITYQSGFNSKSTFNFFFRQAVGLTPSAYRKKYLPK